MDLNANMQSDLETWDLGNLYRRHFAFKYLQFYTWAQRSLHVDDTDNIDSDNFDDDDSDDVDGDIFNDKLISINRSAVLNDLVSIGDKEVIENKAAAQLQQNSLVDVSKLKYILVKQQQLRQLFNTYCPECGRATCFAARVSVPAN